MALDNGGSTYLLISHSSMTKATSSAMNVPLGTRKLLCSLAAAARTSVLADMGLLLADDEDEVGHEAQVDEVHGLDQTDGQEQDREELRPRLRLARHAGNGLRAGQAVTDGRTDGTATEGEPAAYHLSLIHI